MQNNVKSFILYVDVRLSPLDYRPNAGRIEVFFNNEWGQVCGDLFTREPAAHSVVCSQLGYTSMSFNLPYGGLNLLQNSRVWIYDINCVGNENTLLECPSDVEFHIGKVHQPCNTAAGVVCRSK